MNIAHPSGDRHWTRTQPERIRRGTDSHAAKLSREQIEAAKVLHDNGHTKSEIARMLGVARVTIWRHLRNT